MPLTPEESAELDAIEQKLGVTDQEAARRSELRAKKAEATTAPEAPAAETPPQPT